jgi:hypothetical protein
MRLGVAFFLMCLFLVATPAFPQADGAITGTVRDSSGAVVPGATVTITDPQRGIHHTATTNSEGDYLFAALATGAYNVTITAPGFEKYQANNVVLRVAEKIRVDVTLVVGKISEVVEVTGSMAGKVDTQSSELAGTITGDQIMQLELNGRNFTQLITLVPGVSNQTGMDAPGVGVEGNVQYAVNGGRIEYNNWEIDGGDNMDNGSNETLNVYPNVDAIEEVRVLTSTYGAQYGRNGSATIEAVTKSGTNNFHGEAFEFLRNEMFNAHNYFDPPGSAKAAYKKHDFGYTFGGPIQKKKTFFFWSQEFRRENTPSIYNNLVPSDRERGGDFSDLCPTPGPSGQAAFTRPGTTGPAYVPISADCPAYQPDRDPNDPNGFLGFPNNNISSLIDHVNSGPMVNLIPHGNTTPPPGQPGILYRAAFGNPTPWHEELFKIDHNFSSRLHGFFRFIHDSWQQETPSPAWSNSSLPGIPGVFIGPGVSVVANLTANASPSLLNEFIFSYTTDHITLLDLGTAWERPSTMTMTGLFNNGFGGSLPQFSVCCNNAYSFTIDPGIEPWYNSNPTYTFRDNITKIIGAHNLQFGVYVVAAQKNEDASVEPEGSLYFGSNPNVSYITGDSTGNAFADMLIGDIAGFSQANRKIKYYFRYKIAEPYLQDDWHVSKRLTLNLGLRLSLFGTYYERYGQADNFEPSFYNPADAPVVSTVDGSITVPGGVNNLTGMVNCGTRGTNSSCMNGHLFNPAPRIGFAFDPQGQGKMAIRGAYGIFFEHMNGDEANVESLEQQPPLVLVPNQPLIHGYTRIGGNGAEYYPFGVVSIPSITQWPYMQQWHLDIQREIDRGTLLTVAYVASKGTHMPLQYDLNQLHPTPASQNPFAPGQVITTAVCNNDTVNGLPNGTPVTGQALVNLTVACGYTGALAGNIPSLDGTVDNDLLRTAFPGYDSINRIDTVASSSYNALQVSGRRNVGGLELTLAYTYSHSIDNSSDRYDSNFVDSYNLRHNRASSNFDQRQIGTVSYVYKLPIFQHAHGKTKSFLGGWEVSGISTMQTGVPFMVTSGTYWDNAGVANGFGSGSYPDVVGDAHAPIPAAWKYVPAEVGPLLFNPAAFQQPTALTFGNAGRNYLNVPRRTNFDMGLFKSFAMGEKRALEFRAEGFNIFNHPQWWGVNGNIGCYGPTSFNAGDPACVLGSAADGFVASDFLRPSGAHDPRIMQFGLKFIF